MTSKKVDPRITKVFSIANKKSSIRIGFADIDLWVDTGIPAVNRKLSNTWHKGLLYGRTVGIYGESGSGKSLFLAQCAANAQKQHGAYVVWIDVEGAVSDKKTGEQWFLDIGLDINEANFQRLHLATYSDALSLMSGFVNQWREDEYKKELPPLFIIFDSYSHLMTDSMILQNEGKKALTGDQGQKAKQLGDLVVRLNGMIEGLRILITGVMHVYDNQEMYGPKHKLTGGNKPVFTASQSLLFSMRELTNKRAIEDCPHLVQSRDTDDLTKTIGIQSTVKTLKVRYAKPFETLELNSVYGCNIDKYSGLWETFMDDGTIYSPTSGWYEFKRPDGTTSGKFRRSDFLKHVDELMSFPIPARIMNKAEDLEKELFEDDTTETE